MRKKQLLLDRLWVRMALLLVGIVMMAASYKIFFIPNKIAPGGFSGLATVLYYQFGFPVGMVTLALNVPLYLFAWRQEGLRFILGSLAATILLSLMIDAPFEVSVTQDMLLACVYGGALLGVGLGLVVRAGYTTGGTDMLAKLLSQHFHHLSFGGVLLVIESVVVGASAIVFGMEAALYAVVALLLSSKLVDMIQEGFGAAKAFYIISSKAEQIADGILSELERGVTGLKGKGMYTQKEQNVLFCVIHRSETFHLKQLVRQIDPDAFVIVSDVREAMGEGFTQWPVKK